MFSYNTNAYMIHCTAAQLGSAMETRSTTYPMEINICVGVLD